MSNAPQEREWLYSCACVWLCGWSSKANLCLNPNNKVPRRQDLVLDWRWEEDGEWKKWERERLTTKTKGEDDRRGRSDGDRWQGTMDEMQVERREAREVLGDWNWIRGSHDSQKKLRKRCTEREAKKREADGKRWGSRGLDGKDFGEERMTEKEIEPGGLRQSQGEGTSYKFRFLPLLFYGNLNLPGAKWKKY